MKEPLSQLDCWGAANFRSMTAESIQQPIVKEHKKAAAKPAGINLKREKL